MECKAAFEPCTIVALSQQAQISKYAVALTAQTPKSQRRTAKHTSFVSSVLEPKMAFEPYIGVTLNQHKACTNVITRPAHQPKSHG